MTIIDQILAQADVRPAHAAVVEGGAGGVVERTVDYAAVAGAIARGRARRSVLLGDRCGMVAPQGADFILQGLEVMAAGGCLFPISDRISGATLDLLVQRVKLHHLVVNGEWSARPDPGDVDGADDRAFRALEPAFIRFTSGTTHTNKGVILGHLAVTQRIDAANRGLGIGPDDRVLWLLPMAHHWVVSILLYLAHGATVLVPRGGTVAARALAERQGATVFYAAPQDFAALADVSPGRMALQPRLAVSTASGLTPKLAERVGERLGFTLVQALGMIEVGLPAMNLAHAADKPLSVGRPLPDYRIHLRGSDGDTITGLGPDHVGEILVEGPGLYAAYMDPWRPAPPGAFATGDNGYFDQDGDLFVVGRRHNRILTGGMKFFCEEVEQAVEKHPSVAACRVLARPDDILGEVPVVEVELGSGAAPFSSADLARFLGGSLPPHMIPVEVRVVETIARTPTGKIRRW
ncbi:MAG: class I adenylate-forming enzyme family protein [Candidatus Methylacidiphilales bacterium]|nr:class I adenylate-forming enzyme family protein [Candidatus Methylacidiphilales bacterium]